EEEGPYMPTIPVEGEITPRSQARFAELERGRQSRLPSITPYLLTNENAIRTLDAYAGSENGPLKTFKNRFAFVQKENEVLLYWVDKEGDVLKRTVDLREGFRVLPQGDEPYKNQNTLQEMIKEWVTVD